jgi:hypothetical protein
LVCGPLSDADAANTEQSILLLIHRHVPSGMTDAFHAIAFTGPAGFVGRRVVLGLELSQWTHPGRRCVRDLSGRVYRSNQPPQRGVAAAAVGMWITLVALSRLVLGAHWLSEVAAPTGIGTCLPFAMMFGGRLFLRGQEPDSRSKMEPQP